MALTQLDRIARRQREQRIPYQLKCNAGRCTGTMLQEDSDEFEAGVYRCTREGCIFHDNPPPVVERAWWTERAVL